MYSAVDRIIYRLTARRWNRLAFSVLTEARRGQHGPALTDEQLYPLLAQFDPTQRPAWRRVQPGMAGLLPAPGLPYRALDRLGWPVQLLRGRPVLNAIRLLLHTRSIARWRPPVQTPSVHTQSRITEGDAP